MIAFPPFSIAHLPAGTRLGLMVSGGADSVALLRLAHALAPKYGWTLRVLHINHGLRGADSTNDAAWVQALAAELGIACTVFRTEVGMLAANIEEAGRAARYSWVKRLFTAGELDRAAAGHTLDDQAETVLAHLLRGAWTRGLGGIHPAVSASDLPGPPGSCAGLLVRPLLQARRAELRAYLHALGQSWREDPSNADPHFTRNRIRHELMAELNPQAAEHLAQAAELAREDESFWQAEVRRLLPALLLPGRAIRGGGRASSTLPGERSLAMEVEALRRLHPALRGRVLRAAAWELGTSLDYGQTARMLALLEGPPGSTPRREQLTSELRAERTPRELRLLRKSSASPQTAPDSFAIPIPGEGEGFGVRVRVEAEGSAHPPATLRAACPGDRVRLRHSSGAPKRIKEVLERMGVAPPDRAGWPVLEWRGEIVWVRGAQLEPTPLNRQIAITEAMPPPTTP